MDIHNRKRNCRKVSPIGKERQEYVVKVIGDVAKLRKLEIEQLK